MLEKLIKFIPKDHCNLEKSGEKCSNHPTMHPETHKPDICVECIGKINLPKTGEKLLVNKNSCALEGADGRPEDCKNNPFRYPDSNWIREACLQCIFNPEVTKIVERPLPTTHIEFLIKTHPKNLKRT